MRKVLNLSYLKTIEGNNNDEIDGLLDDLPKHELEKTDWLVLKKVPKVSFAMAYNIDYIFVKFYVEEPYFKCDHLKIHDPVFEDSCVELFICFDSDENYYN